MKHKKLYRAGVFVLLLALLISLCSLFFAPHDLSNGYISEPDNSLDFLAIGDSECLTSISPMKIWEEYGYAGYNCGVYSERIQDAYYYLQKLLGRQSPKVVFLETNMIFRTTTYAKELTNVVNSFTAYAIPLFQFHSRWKSPKSLLQHTDIKQRDDCMRGLHYTTDQKAYSGANYINASQQRQDIPWEQMRYFRKIIELCQANGIQLVLYSTPSPVCWSYARHNSVQQVADEYGLAYLDMNLDLNDVGIDWTTDTYDGGDHVNFSGAEKVSSYLGAYLYKNCSLTDHSTDPLYADWNTDLASFKEKTGNLI